MVSLCTESCPTDAKTPVLDRIQDRSLYGAGGEVVLFNALTDQTVRWEKPYTWTTFMESVRGLLGTSHPVNGQLGRLCVGYVVVSASTRPHDFVGPLHAVDNPSRADVARLREACQVGKPMNGLLSLTIAFVPVCLPSDLQSAPYD